MEEIDCYYYDEDEMRQRTIDRFKAAGWTHRGPGLCFSKAPAQRKYYPKKVKEPSRWERLLRNLKQILGLQE